MYWRVDENASKTAFGNEYWRVDDDADLLSYAHSIVSDFDRAPLLGHGHEWKGRCATLLFLAWACWRSGHDEMGMRIFSRLSVSGKDAMSTPETFSELIYSLRDENVNFSDWLVVAEPTRARKLVELGLQAVPMLISALDDSRLTRIVKQMHEDGISTGGMPENVTVGECCRWILTQIGEHGLGSPFKDHGNIETAKREASEWYRSVQEKGEMAVLVDRTKEGDLNAGSQLIQKYPDSAFTALVSGFTHSKDKAFIELIGRCDTPEVVALLQSEYEKNPNCRLAWTRQMPS